MKGVRFYLEYPNKKEKRNATRKELGNHSGNVIAVLVDNVIVHPDGNGVHWLSGYDAMAGLFDKPNSPVASSVVGLDYLDERCKWISEEKAREIHPELFKRLDYEVE
jgi:hypothetical protein